MNHGQRLITCCALALIAAFAGALRAHSAASGPTGLTIDRNAYPDDASALQALQEAVDAGGVVIVSGVFTLADG